MKQSIDLNQFNVQQGYGVSSRYKVINTIELLKPFQDAGFEVSRIAKARVNNPEREGYQRHAIWLRHAKMLEVRSNAIPELMLLTAHDGTCAAKIYKTIYRPACSNGLVLGARHGIARIIHVGDAVTKAVNEALKLANEASGVVKLVARMELTWLSGLQALDFARQAGEIVYPENAMFEAAQLLVERREADAGQDLWTVFNVVQENLLKGGAKYVMQKPDGKMRKNSLRAVGSLNRSVELNQKLFDLAETFIRGV